MHGLFDGAMPIEASLAIVLVIAAGILSLGYALGAYIGDRGVALSRRFTAAGLAAAIGIALLAPAFSSAGDACERASLTATARGCAAPTRLAAGR
jgi:hypothetical protein